MRLTAFVCSPTSTIIAKLNSLQMKQHFFEHTIRKWANKTSKPLPLAGTPQKSPEMTYTTVNTIQRKADKHLSHADLTLMSVNSRLLTNYAFGTRPHPNAQKKHALIWAAASANPLPGYLWREIPWWFFIFSRSNSWFASCLCSFKGMCPQHTRIMNLISQHNFWGGLKKSLPWYPVVSCPDPT